MLSLEEAKSKILIQSERGSSIILKFDSPNVKTKTKAKKKHYIYIHFRRLE